jgi:hypothetical protein
MSIRMSDKETALSGDTSRLAFGVGHYGRAEQYPNKGVLKLGPSHGFVRLFNDEVRVGLPFVGHDGRKIVAALELGDASDLSGLVEGQALEFTVISREGRILAVDVHVMTDAPLLTGSVQAQPPEAEESIPDVRDVSVAMGACPGVSLPDPVAREVFGKIVASAVDLFGDSHRSASALKLMRFGPTKTGILNLIKTGQTPRILNRLNDIRFGSQG